MIEHLTRQIAGCTGVSDLGAGLYEVLFSDGARRAATDDEIAAATVAAARAAIKPVTRRQMKLALHAAGLLTMIEFYISNSNDVALKINYEEALEFERNNPLIAQVAGVLGKTDEEIDSIFELARSM